METHLRQSGDKTPRTAVLLVASGVLLAWHALFSRYFPSSAGSLGHDYSSVLPNLLEGYFWYIENGAWSVPWFTPAFCAGVPVLANPESGYYSLPQLLTLWMDPLRAAYASALIFAALGFAGSYALLSRAFRSSWQSACVGAALFTFNGFFAHRMLIGHLGFHAFMLVPLVCFWLLAPGGRRWEGNLTRVCGLGLALAYTVLSGMVNGIAPAGLAIAMVVALHAALRSSAGALRALRRAAAALPLAIALCAAKLAAAVAYTSHFPRDLYRLPGLPSPWDGIRLAFSALFLGPPVDEVRSAFTDLQWLLERHELAFGLTPVPLLLLVAAAVRSRRALAAVLTTIPNAPRQLIAPSVLVALAAVPLALNFHTPVWNALLKSLPLLGSSSSLVRFWASYIPVIAVAAALALDFSARTPRVRGVVAALAILAVVLWNAWEDHSFYAEQRYPPETIRAAWLEAASTRAAPAITRVDLYRTDDGEPVHPIFRNDALTEGVSQLACHHAVFGYRLEEFPEGALRIGPVFEERYGVLNLKNPACYVHPAENGCAPGDHFSSSDLARAERFARRQPFAFEISRVQAAANALNSAAAAGVALLLAAAATSRVLRSRSAVARRGAPRSRSGDPPGRS